MARKPKKQTGIVATRKQAAEILGVSDRHLGRWVHEPWFPENGRTESGWNVPAIRKARDAQGRKGSEYSETSRAMKLKLDAENLKQLRIGNRRAELKLLEQEAELLPRRSFETFVSVFLESFGSWSSTIAETLVSDLPRRLRAKAKTRLDNELSRKHREMRGELEAKLREIGVGPTGDAGEAK